MGNDRSGKSWTEVYPDEMGTMSDDDRLRILAHTALPTATIAARLQRRIPATQHRASKLRLSLATGDRLYSAADKRALLERIASGQPVRAAAAGLPVWKDRDPHAVYAWLHFHGVKVGEIRANLNAALEKVGVVPSQP